MNNETFGITLQAAICEYFDLQNDISASRVDGELLEFFLDGDIVTSIFESVPSKPVRFLTTSREYVDYWVKKCPHNFILENGETFSIKTFRAKNKKYAPKIVGQPGNKTINHFFGHLVDYEINRESFRKFCFERIDEIVPILLDYSLVSDFNCYFFISDDGSFEKRIYKRGVLPDLVFDKADFEFTRASEIEWNESNSFKYRNITAGEFQLHNHRAGFKLRLSREFLDLVYDEEESVESIEIFDYSTLNNSVLGDSAELSICQCFNLQDGINDERLISNSSQKVVDVFYNHYKKNIKELFPLRPIKYSGTSKRERGGASKSGVDFYLENNYTLSLKTNKNRSKKVCPPEIGQPSPKTFDLHFKESGLYEGEMDATKFRYMVKDVNKLCHLLAKYVYYLNECDFILWSIFLTDSEEVRSKNISKEKLNMIEFDPNEISYTNDFITHDSVTIKYLGKSLGEFQIHSARNSLKFRFNMDTLLSL